MNFLAHIYLSGNNDLLKIGNFMADGIRGNSYLQYPTDVKNGIILHRSIDFFTDSHPIYRQSKHRLHEKYKHYSGVIMDIVYDHYLAKNWSKYSNEKLEDYVDNFYKLLEDNFDVLTEKVQKILPTMKAQNWLLSYASLSGLEMILFNMDYRTKHRAHMQEAIIEVTEFYNNFEEEFTLFFIELENHCKEKLATL